jgi:EAL domain-containing protein (putative c-di-GMP-specific phosphodiesterase class I)
MTAMSAVVDQNRNTARLTSGDSPEVAFQQPVAAQPVVFIVEEDLADATTLLNVAQGSQVRCEVLASCAGLVDAMGRSTPDLIMLEVTTEATNAVETLHALSQRAFPGLLQLVSYPGVAMVEPLRQLAELHSLRILPPITKPIEISTIRSVLRGLTTRVSQAKTSEFAFEEAVKNGWTQFWYQPKISFRNKTLVGIETFVRLFHPNKGLVPAAVALHRAGDRGLTALAHHALLETAAASTMLAELGLNPSITINATLKVLQTLPIARIFRDHVAKTTRQPNWIFDVSEEDISENLATVKHLSAIFRSVGIKLAVDNFSGKMLSLSTLRDLPIAEIKLSPSFVAHCSTNAGHAAVCKALIDLAHDLPCEAVGVGIETVAQSQTLQRLGCDVGQGCLFGHPLPLKQITAMIKQRAVQAAK